MRALEVYRSRFRPSEFFAQPHVMLAVNVSAADTDEEAKRLFTSHQQAFVNLRRGAPGPLPPPNERFLDGLTPQERWEIDQALSVSAVGSGPSVQRALAEFIGRTRADELIIVTQIHDHAARLRSYEITSAAHGRME